MQYLVILARSDKFRNKQSARISLEDHACTTAVIAVAGCQENTAYLRVVALLYADCTIRSGRMSCSPRE
jgi:hypothetical protein